MTSVDKFLYDGESVCIGRKGTIDKPIFLTGKFWTVDTLFYTYAFHKCLPKFLYLIFQQINWYKYNEAGGVPSLLKTTIGNINIFIPNNENEQKKIVDCFSSLDDLINAVADKIETLKEYKKGLMQQLFPAEGKTTPAFRFPEFQNKGEWEESTLGDICDMQAGKFVSASEICDVKKDTMYPCYGGNGLRGYTHSFTHFGIYPLIGRQGAQCGNITYAEGKFHATEHAVVVTLKKDIDIRWLYYQLIKLDLNQYATGQAQPGLSVDVIKKVTIRIPKNKTEQHLIAYLPEGWPQTLRALGFTTAAMALCDASLPIYAPQLKRADRLAVVLGTEGDGLAESTIAACDCTVRIPMTHGVDSLNVAAASAVAFYQLALLAGLSETED